MRAIGFVGDVKVRDQVVPRHAILNLPDKAAEEMRGRYGASVCDLTPKFMFRQFGGVGVPLRMTPIRVGDCPACITYSRGGTGMIRIRRARLDDCLDCGNSTRLVL